MAGLMDKLRGVKESTGGFSDIEPGAYKLVITKAEPHPKEQYVKVFWDVAEGPSKGAYAQSQYPPSDVMSWKDSALGMLKMKQHRLCQCNPQRLHAVNDGDGEFVGMLEFAKDVDEGGSFAFLVGCRFGAVVRRRIYTAGPMSKEPGADRVQMEIATYLTPQEFRDGDWSERLLADRDARDKDRDVAQASVEHSMPTPPAQAYAHDDLYDEDVPF